VAAVYYLRLRAIALALRGPPAMSQVAGLSAVIDRRFSMPKLHHFRVSFCHDFVLSVSSIGVGRLAKIPYSPFKRISEDLIFDE